MKKQTNKKFKSEKKWILNVNKYIQDKNILN